MLLLVAAAIHEGALNRKEEISIKLPMFSILCLHMTLIASNIVGCTSVQLGIVQLLIAAALLA